MNIQGFQKLTLLDFPGKVACTVFTGGCNFRCPFCHNGSLVLEPTIYSDATKDVFDYLSKRKGIVDGVCITGGEPLLQTDIESFMREVKDMGYALKLDTNGSFPSRLLKVIETGLIDYIAMDIKSSPEGYPLAVGTDVDMTAICQSVEIIRQSGVEHEFRTTAVKGIHTTEDFDKIGQWLAGSKHYYIQRFVDSGNLIKGGEAFSDDEMHGLLSIIKNYIPEAQLRGQN